MKIQAVMVVVSLWMGMGAQSAFATNWDSCRFGEQSGKEQIYLKSDYYEGSYANSFSVDAQDEASQPIEFYYEVESESDDTQITYFANDDFNLKIFWETCSAVDGSFHCEARFKAAPVNGGKAIEGYCDIQHKLSRPKPRPCRPGIPSRC